MTHNAGRPRAAVLAVVAALLAACGSTAPKAGDQGVAVADRAPAGEQPAETKVRPGEPHMSATDAGGPAGAIGRADPGTSNPSSSAAAPRGEDRSVPAASAEAPVTRRAQGAPEPVEVGIYVSENVEEVAASVGASGVALGDQEAQALAVVDDMNARGGLGGRPVEPVIAVFDPASGSDYAVQEQRACARWTEDHDVIAAVSAVNTYGVLAECLAQRGVPFLAQNQIAYTRAQQRAWPLFFTTGMLAAEPMARAYVGGLDAAGFFGDGARIGLVRFDDPEYERVARQVIEPLLRDRGLDLVAEAAISMVERTSDAGSLAAQTNSAQLQFRSRGVTHVLFQDWGGSLALFFMTAAEGNGYRPAYGLTSYNSPRAMLQASAPHEQLTGSAGVGIWPMADVDDAQDPGLNAAGERCLAVMEAAGVALEDRSAVGSAFKYCDNLSLLHAAVAQAGAVDGGSIAAAIESLGSRVPSAQTFFNHFAPGSHDGAAATRMFAWDDGCACFDYTGAVEPIGAGAHDAD